MKIYLLVIINILLFSSASSYRFTLPGDSKWPTYEQFIQLKISLDGNLFIRGEQGYNPHTYNTRNNNPKPAAILQPNTEQDIQKGIYFAQKYSLRLTVQSTGHQMDIRNTADNSLLIDMSSMQKLAIDVQNRQITVQTGARYQDIIKYIDEKSNKTLSIVSGADGSVGSYGFSVGGGHGRLTRMYGLGADAILNIKIVLANGKIVNANQEENHDLFWALRGSGGQPFGVGIEITFRLVPDPGPVSVFMGAYSLNNQTGADFGQWMTTIPDNIGAYYFPLNFPFPLAAVEAFCFGENIEECQFYLQQLEKNCVQSPETPCQPELKKYPNYNAFQLSSPIDQGGDSIYIIGTTFDSDTIVDGLSFASGFVASLPFYEVGVIGCAGNGVMGGVSPTLDPFNRYTSVPQQLRTGLMGLTCWIALDGEMEDQLVQIALILAFSEALRPYGKDYVYWNEGQHDYLTSDEWKTRYWGSMENYNKILTIKKKYDPQNFMTCYQCIGWDEVFLVDPAICPKADCQCSNTPYGQCADTSPLIPTSIEK